MRMTASRGPARYALHSHASASFSACDGKPIMNDVGPWPTLYGSWGWKMSVDQFAKLIAAVESGTIMPKEYWTLMKRSADTNDYGYAMSRICSDFPRVRAGGAYYSHNGRDGTNSEIAGQGSG